ncbi:MAG: type II toxin-antitoxin system RelE/ParE family toxin [Bdellovibrionales bacterium]
MNVLQTPLFRKAVKKLNNAQKKCLDSAINQLMKSPFSGDRKKGDLADIFVYKFKMGKQLALLAYNYHEDTVTLTLLMLGSHENFYRDLKRHIH